MMSIVGLLNVGPILAGVRGGKTANVLWIKQPIPTILVVVKVTNIYSYMNPISTILCAKCLYLRFFIAVLEYYAYINLYFIFRINCMDSSWNKRNLKTLIQKASELLTKSPLKSNKKNK